MPMFRKDAYRTPVGVNVYLRSTKNYLTESYTVAAASVPDVTIDTATGQKVLQKGMLMAKITSGGDAGKIGPYQRATGNEAQTITVTGTPTGGTFKLELPGVGVTEAINFDDTAAEVEDFLEALVGAGNVTCTGGPFPGTAVVATFAGTYAGLNVQELLLQENALTGGSTPTVTTATTTAPGAVAGATDGRGDPANIVGFCNTFLPWQLTEGDREIAVVYEAAVVQANCLEQIPAGTYVALTDSTASQVLANGRTKNVTFH